ncbi:MAG: ABC transporter permease [Oscillospiraceae bacterium]
MNLLMTLLGILIMGAAYGLVLFVIATGMSLTLGLMRVVNMSHGAIYMFAGYCGIAVYSRTQNWFLAIIVGTLVGAALGAVLEIGFLRRLYKHPTYQVLLTIGMINILNNVAQWIWGGQPMTAPIPDFLTGGFPMGSITVPWIRVFMIIFGGIMCILLWLLQDKTRVGAMVRAGMDNREVAATLGINNKLIFTGVFILGSAVAGASAMIGGSVTGVGAGTAWSVLLNSIIVVVVGGTGSIQGALLGGLIIGVANAFGTVYLPNMTPFLMYLILIIVLLIKPSGLLGRKVDVNKAIEADLEKTGSKGHPDPMPRAEVVIRNGRLTAKMSAFRAVPYLVCVLFLVLCPLFMKPVTVSMMSKALIFALFAASLDVVMGYGGMRSFGHAAYFGLGGYTVTLLYTHANITNFWLVLIAVLVVCAAFGAIISYFTLKFSGTYFLIVTMAFGQLLSAVATKWIAFTGGSDGQSGHRPDLGFSIKWNQTKLFYFVLICFLVCFIILKLIMRSSFGRSIVGIRENEGRMKALGYNTWKTKYVACIIAAIFAGIAGMLYAYIYMIMTPTDLDLTTSAKPMLMVIMGGGSTLWGPAIGGFIITLFETYSGQFAPERWPLLLGLLYVVCVLFLRGGISPYLTRLYNWVGYKLFPNGEGTLVPKKAKKAAAENVGEEMKK